MNREIRDDIQFWACLILSTIAYEADRPWLGVFWTAFALITAFMQWRRR